MKKHQTLLYHVYQNRSRFEPAIIGSYASVISRILSSISLILALYISFLAISFFTTLLSLFKSTGTTSNLSTLLLKLFKPVGTFCNL